MGERALISHDTGQNHQKALANHMASKPITNFFPNVTNVESQQASTSSSTDISPNNPSDNSNNQLSKKKLFTLLNYLSFFLLSKIFLHISSHLKLVLYHYSKIK